MKIMRNGLCTHPEDIITGPGWSNPTRNSRLWIDPPIVAWQMDQPIEEV